MGSIIRVTCVGNLSDPKSGAGATMPVILGGGVTIAVTVGIRQMVQPTSTTNVSIIENAPLVGAVAGLTLAGVLYAMRMQPAGLAAAAAAAVAGLGMWGLEYSAKMKAAQIAATAAAPAKTAGLRAVVPEYSMRGTRGLGAIVMEPHASRGYGAGALGSYGETVNLGAINPAAFGTPGFHFGR
jgi:hypothetical protein